MDSTPFDFNAEVIEKSRTVPVLVDFWASWCSPCRALAPILEIAAEKAAGRWILVKVDTEAHPEVAGEHQIRSIPAVKLFVDGAVIAEFTGAMPEKQFEQWLAKALPSPWAERVAVAAAAAADGDADAAVSMLEEVLLHEPSNVKARAMLAELLLPSRPAEAAEHAEALEREPDYADLCDALRVLSPLLARHDADLPAGTSKDAYASAVGSLRLGDYDVALERFIEVLRNDRDYDDDGSRKACIAIFRLLGEEHAVTLKYRRAFDRAF